MRKLRKCVSAVTSLVLAASYVPFGSFASAEAGLSDNRGDIHLDGILSVADAVCLQRYLLGAAALETQAEWEQADLTGDGRVNGLDLTLLRQKLLRAAEPQETPFLDAPIAAIGSSLPSQGNGSLVVFYIDFPDCSYSNKLSSSELQEIIFGSEDASSVYYPFESMSAFYTRSSKGAMGLTGQVFAYTAKESIAAYGTNKVKLAEECYEAFRDSVDFSAYDSNADGLIDATLFTVPETASDEDWWPCAGAFGDQNYTVDGVQIGHIITGNADPDNILNFNSSYLHEMGHCMGLPDYYLYYTPEDGEGMHGPSGTELMDMDAYSDFSAFSKLMLGWYHEDQIAVYDSSQGTQTFQLHNAQTENGNCVILPRGAFNDSYFSEYFILEYATEDGNNSGIVSQNWADIASGVRIYHIQAEKYEDRWSTFFKYQNGSSFTNSDDDGIRLIRLVNDGGVWKSGDVVHPGTPGFGWYDAQEQESIDPGVEIQIGELGEDGCTITISPKE